MRRAQADADPDMGHGARIEDDMPTPLHRRRVDRPERAVYEPAPCCAKGRVVYDCTCAYRTVCKDCGDQCHGRHE